MTEDKRRELIIKAMRTPAIAIAEKLARDNVIELGKLIVKHNRSRLIQRQINRLKLWR